MVDSGPLTFVGRLTRAELIAFAMHDLLRRRGRRLVASSLTIPAAFLVMIWLTHSPIWCCQSNGNLSPLGRNDPKPVWL